MCEALRELMKDEIEAARKEGWEEGYKRGVAETIYGLVSEGDRSPEKGAQKLGVSVEQLKADMDTHGFHI